MLKFYDLLIPFMTGKPLEQSLIEAELGTLKGPWRLPQRSDTAYVRCIFEALHYMLVGKGVSETKASQFHLALEAELISMVENDIKFVSPDENGRRVCEMALSSFR